MKQKVQVCFTFMILCAGFALSASSETVVLKSGKSIEGKIIEKAQDYIKLDISGVSVTYYKDEIKNIVDDTTEPSATTIEPAADTISIHINPMIELDYKTKKEIYEFRENLVLQYPQLVKTKYAPREEIFGQIVDKKPWWGILGLSYYGAGDKAIEGPSEESRFIANPFLLVGLDAGHGLKVDDKNLSPVPIYPEPTNLIWSQDGTWAKITYRLGDFWRKQKRYHDPSASEHALELIAYNARDMGYNFLYIDPAGSRNLSFSSYRNTPVAIQQFIHCGGSCGYPGGCNNMSPDQPDLQIKINDTPAVVKIKLWKNMPAKVEQTADVVFTLDLISQ